MPIILFPIEQFRTLPKYSIAISACINKNSEFLHSGIVFNLMGKIHFLHLATHKYLQCDNYHEILNDYSFFIYTNFSHLIKTDPHFFRRKALIAYMQALFEKNKNTIPYSFLFKRTPFDKTKTYNPGFGQYGLTCSTFVMAVFESNGIHLCEKESWPKREDDIVIRDRIISIYKKDRRVPPEHISIMENEISCIRFRPEEVLCTSSKLPLPCTFKELRDCSHKVLANIEAN